MENVEMISKIVRIILMIQIKQDALPCTPPRLAPLSPLPFLLLTLLPFPLTFLSQLFNQFLS